MPLKVGLGARGAPSATKNAKKSIGILVKGVDFFYEEVDFSMKGAYFL